MNRLNSRLQGITFKLTFVDTIQSNSVQREISHIFRDDILSRVGVRTFLPFIEFLILSFSGSEISVTEGNHIYFVSLLIFETSLWGIRQFI